MGAHFGDNANSSNAVLRYANVNNEPSNANTNIGSSLRERAKKLAWAKGEDGLVDSRLTVRALEQPPSQIAETTPAG